MPKKEKIIFPAYRNSKTALGVMPRESEPKTVTIKNLSTGEKKRIKWNEAEKLVKTGEWAFCPKKK